MSSLPSRISALRARLAGLETAPFIAFLTPAVLVLAFFKIASEMQEGETDAMDRAALAALRTPGDPHDPLGPRWFDTAMRDITSLGSTSVLTLLTLAAVGFLLVMGRRGAALAVALSISGGTLVSFLLKSAFERTRPAFIADGVSIDTFSFPSGHAMLSAVTYLTLGALLTQAEPQRRVKVFITGVAITVTVLVGLSRVYLGVHYPTDVLAGWIVGVAWAMGCREVERLVEAPRT